MTWQSPFGWDGTAPGRDDAARDGDRGGGFDPSRPHPARVYLHWLGGKDTLGPDRAVAARVAEVAPWVVAGARGNRGFLTRVVACLARAGVSQFLDVGSGLPAAGNVHEVAQGINPDAKVVYLDNDPIVLVHARALLACDRTIAVAGDARDPGSILANPDVRKHLDFGRPIAVLFIALLHFFRDDDDPAGIVAAFRDALVPGSFIAISHVADLPDDGAGPARAAATREAVDVYEQLAAPFVLRTPDQISGLFAGLELVDPGVVPVQLWRPARGRPGAAVPVLGGVGQVPSPGHVPSSSSGHVPTSSSGHGEASTGPHLDVGCGRNPTPMPGSEGRS